MQKWNVTVGEDSAGLRLDKFLALSFPEISRAHFAFLIKEGLVNVDSLTIDSVKYKVIKGQSVIAEDSHKTVGDIPVCDIELKIVYEDEWMMVIDKPEGLIVHPVGRTKDSVIGALINRNSILSNVDPQRPGIVHRLDKTTSGLMLIAKDDHIHAELAELFANRRIHKEYTAIVRGRLLRVRGKIEVPLKRIPGTHKMRTSDTPDARESLTMYECIKSKDDYHLLNVVIRTGRMHQIRVHMKYIGCPVVGDTKYGGCPAPRIMLHCSKLSFIHPRTLQQVIFESQMPDAFNEYV